MEKTYNKPKFELVGMDKSNRVFFTASGPGPSPAPTLSAAITSMTKVSGSW